MKVNTYNDKRKARYGQKYFIGCEDMVVKQIRACKVGYVHTYITCRIRLYVENDEKITHLFDDRCFSDDELLTVMGLFEMYSTPLMNNSKVMVVMAGVVYWVKKVTNEKYRVVRMTQFRHSSCRVTRTARHNTLSTG